MEGAWGSPLEPNRMQSKHRLSYANVASTLAIFLALGGGAAYAANEIRSGDIAPGAVRTADIHKRAVASGKLAVGAVRSNQIADGSVGSRQIGAAAVAPSNLEFPVFVAATPSGGSAPVTSGPDPYPIANGTWTQKPGQIQVLFGAAAATLAYDDSGSGLCQVFFEISLNGRQVGGGQISTSSTTPTRIEQSVGAEPQIDPLNPTTVQVTARTGSNGDCTEDSRIESSRFRILDFG
jgi:hypothetical protein